MIFKELFAIFGKDTLLDRAYKRSYQMVDITHEMFVKAKTSLREMDISQLNIDIATKSNIVLWTSISQSSICRIFQASHFSILDVLLGDD